MNSLIENRADRQLCCYPTSSVKSYYWRVATVYVTMYMAIYTVILL